MSAAEITDINPSQGTPAGGEPVVITGMNLANTTAVNWDSKTIGLKDLTVDRNGTNVTVNSCPTGNAHSVVDISVATSTNGTSNVLTFTYSAAFAER